METVHNLKIIILIEMRICHSVCRSRSRLEPPLLGRLRSRSREPEPPCLCNKHEVQFIKTNMIHKRFLLIIYFFICSSKWQILVSGVGAAFFAWSRSWSQPLLAGAGVGSGTSDVQSRSCRKKAACNTGVTRDCSV